MMNRFRSRVVFLAVGLMFSFVLGCTESSKPSVVTDQSELEKWAAENPPPTDVDPELMGDGG